MYGSSGISIRPYPAWGRKAMVYIDRGASYGTLLRSYYDDNDKEIYVYGDTLYDVSIGDGAGFLANEQEPDSAVEVHITAKRTYYDGGSVNEHPIDFPITGKDTISGSTTITIEPNKLHHFKVAIVPDTAATADTVAFTEGATLYIQAQDKDSVDIEYDGNTLLKFLLATNEEYGTFINANGDTLKTTPVQLTDVLYSDAQAGRIKFAAVKKNPDSLVICKIHVEKQSDPTKLGERDAIVVEQTLKIVMDAPYEVVPRNLRGLRNSPNPANENKKRFTVRLTRNKVGIANHPFLLTTNYVDGTGGHDHLTPRRVRNRDNYGYLIVKRTNDTTDSPYTGQTQGEGREIFDYVSTFFGDSMRISVESTNPKKRKFLKDSVTIVEIVRDLSSLGEGTNYILVGGMCEHHGPSDRGIAANCQTPNNNHWGTATLIQVVQAVTDSFATTYPGYRLRINDMSLPFGGKFEIDGSWNQTADHQQHRMGINADVNLNAYNDGVDVSLNSRQRRRLWILIRNLAGRNAGNETNRNHYHIQ
jgi:hypothetical protein